MELMDHQSMETDLVLMEPKELLVALMELHQHQVLQDMMEKLDQVPTDLMQTAIQFQAEMELMDQLMEMESTDLLMEKDSMQMELMAQTDQLFM